MYVHKTKNCTPNSTLKIDLFNSCERVFLVVFLRKTRISLKVMGKILKNPKISQFLLKSKKTWFLLFFSHSFSGFLKMGNFRARNEASLLNPIVLANQKRFFHEIFFKRKIMIQPSIPETIFAIFATCYPMRSRVMTSQVVTMTKSVSNYTTFRKNWKSWTKIAREMIPTVLASLLYVVIRKNTKKSVGLIIWAKIVISLWKLQ